VTADAEERSKAFGRAWAAKDIDQIIGEISETHPPPSAQTQAILEVTRRQIRAIEAFDRAAGRQATVMIRLTWAMTGLTIVIAGLTALLVWKEFFPHG
jgi:hypothetical protein